MRALAEPIRTRARGWAAWVPPGLMAGVLLAGVAAAAAPPETFETYRAPDGSFTVTLPKGWEKHEGGHPYGDLTPISGVRLTGPKGADGAPATLSALHYSGERLFRNPDEFIQRQLDSMRRIDRDQKPAITGIEVAKRPARRFQIKTFELVYLPHPALPPVREGVVYEIAPPSRQVGMVDQFIVIPASKGYFVLGYRAQDGEAGEHQETFARMAGSFSPQLP